MFRIALMIRHDRGNLIVDPDPAGLGETRSVVQMFDQQRRAMSANNRQGMRIVEQVLFSRLVKELNAPGRKNQHSLLVELVVNLNPLDIGPREREPPGDLISHRRHSPTALYAIVSDATNAGRHRCQAGFDHAVWRPQSYGNAPEPIEHRPRSGTDVLQVILRASALTRTLLCLLDVCHRAP